MLKKYSIYTTTSTTTTTTTTTTLGLPGRLQTRKWKQYVSERKEKWNRSRIFELWM